jgi:hypothetical protein
MIVPSSGMAAAAAAQSAAAMAQAHAARVTACEAMVSGYRHETASESQMREYASCVGVLHPAPITAGEEVWLKVGVAILLASFFGGGAWGWWTGSGSGLGEDVMNTVMGALFGLLMAALGIASVAGVTFGVRFLLS